MRFLRLAFPPLIVWMLGVGLFWALKSQDALLGTEAGILAAFDLNLGSAEPQQTTFVLPSAKVYDDQLRLIAERPLFSETRRVPDPEPIEDPEYVPEAKPVFEEEVVIEEPPEPPAFMFKGFVRNGDELQALLGLAEVSEEQWVSEGDELFEWTVQKISPDSVRLELDGFQHVVEISQ